jgi:hypothetical protein
MRGFAKFILLTAFILPQALSVDTQRDEKLLRARADRLALEVERAGAVRAVKNLQHTYAQYAQFGLWDDMASLFAERAELVSSTYRIQGLRAISEHFLKKLGSGNQGLAEGELRTQFVFRPLVNLSPDGQSAKARWWELSALAKTGLGAEWMAGIYENEYVKERGFWKISRLHYYPMFSGPYENGWRNIDDDLEIVPYHFTSEETGIPIPEIPSGALIPSSHESLMMRVAALEERISQMNDEDKVRNLQNAYGYYVDRKMWDDVADLFAANGVLEVANLGIYEGVKSIRRGLDRQGPAGLKHGQLHDHLQLDMSVSIEPGGTEARARGLELGLLGEADKGTAFLSISVFNNRYVKQNDVWHIREMRIFPVRKTDYYKGWAKSVVVDSTPAPAFAPDRPAPSSDNVTALAIPVFFAPNPGSGRPVRYPDGWRVAFKDRLLPKLPPSAARDSSQTLEVRIREAERKLAISKAYDGTENVSSAYGDYLDDLDFGKLAEIFAIKGAKQIPFAGFYVGRESIGRREAAAKPQVRRARTYLALHLRTQPVILVASDGRSSSIRTRLFQPVSSLTESFGFSGGMYHDQAVLENGSWKLWSVAIDEHYFSSPDYKGGWSAAKDVAPGAAPAAARQHLPVILPTFP